MGSDMPSCGKFQRTAAQSSKLTEDERSSHEAHKEVKDWQKCVSERDAYIKQLQEEAKRKEAKISELQEQLKKQDKQQLLSQLQNAMDKIEELTKRLKEESAKNSESLHVRDEQVKAYKEDFESERTDRQRTQARLADVEMELEIVKRELRQYNLREMQDLHQRRQASLEYQRQDYLRKNPQSVYQMDHFEERNPEDGEDEVD